MKKIRVCYLVVNCKISGPMKQTLNIILNLDKNKYEVFLVTMFAETKGNSMYDDYVRNTKKIYCLGLNKLSTFICGKRKLNEVMKDLKPDIIHSVGMPAYRLSLCYKKSKHLVTIRNYAYEDYPSYYGKITGNIMAYFDIKLMKKKLSNNEILTCSNSLAKIYKEKEKMTIPFIRNGVDIEKYALKNENNVLNLRKKLNIPNDKIVFIYTGAFTNRKDQESAIKGIIDAKNDKLFLILCGNGYNYEKIKEKYKNNSNILFTGKVKNVNEYLRASDIYMSVSKSEGMPNGVLEGMASGLSVLLSDILQHREIFEVDDNIGLLYQLGNDEDLVEKINQITKLDYKSIGKKCRKIVEQNFTSKLMSKQYQEKYQDIVGDDNL